MEQSFGEGNKSSQLITKHLKVPNKCERMDNLYE